MRALVFSGGGAKVHYHVGAATVLLATDGPYDLFAGVSAGALVAAYLTQFPRGFETEAINCLVKVTSALSGADVLKGWPVVGRVAGLWKSSFYSASPLHNLVRRELSVEAVRASGRKLRIGAVSLDGGEFAMFTEQCEHLIAAVLASCALPGFMQPVRIVNQLFVDGGVRVYTPLALAIEAGATEVDVVLTSPARPSRAQLAGASSLWVMARAVELMADEIMTKDLRLAALHNQLAAGSTSSGKRVIKLRVIRPEHDLGVPTGSDFSESASLTRDQGAADALLAIAAG